MGKIKLIRFPNTFRIEFSEKEFVCNKGHYSLDNIEQKRRKDNLLKTKLSFNPIECGGGLEEPPLSYKCGSSKNAQRKSR